MEQEKEITQFTTGKLTKQRIAKWTFRAADVQAIDGWVLASHLPTTA
jgi:hypothetical protein